MASYYVCNAVGEILRTGQCPPLMVELQAPAPGETAYEGDADSAAQYRDPVTGELTLKNTMAATVSGTTISGLPANTTVRVGSQSHLVADGSAELEFDFAGTYQVRCTAPTYFPATYEVVAP